MKKILKPLFCMESMTVLMLFFALASAVATFIENDYGPLGSKSFIYGQTWFELIMLLLTIGVMCNIIWFKMYRKEKFLILLIHISFIFIFVGSVLTRYAGYEATMTIDEGTSQDKIYSIDDFVQIDIKNNNLQESYEHKVLMTELNQTNFSNTFKDFDNLSIEFNKYIPNAVERIVDTENGIAMANLVISTPSGLQNIELKENESSEMSFTTFALNKKIPPSNKPVVSIFSKNNRLYISSNLSISWYLSKDKDKSGKIDANQEEPLSLLKIYKVGQTEFLVREASVSGAFRVVSLPEDKIQADNRVDAILVDIKQGEKLIKQVPLFKNAITQKGFISKVDLPNNTKLNMQWGSKEITLPFSFKLLDFNLQRYPGSNSPSSYSSDIQIIDSNLNTTPEYKIFMNNTLDYEGYRFFQSSYKIDESATILSVNKDPGKTPTYIGYALLFAGLFFNLFSKNGRFVKLSKTRNTIETIKNSYKLKNALSLLAITITLLFQTPTYANEPDIKTIQNIDKTHSDYFGSILIQDYQGRIKPINSLAIEIANKISRDDEILGLDANQFFLSAMLYPEIWQKIDFIKIKDTKLKDVLGVNKNTISLDDIYDTQSNYKLEKYLEEANSKNPANRTKFDNEVIKLDEKLNIAYALFQTDFLKVFPILNDEKNRWVNPKAVQDVLNNNPSIDLNKDEAIQMNKLLKEYFVSLYGALKNSSSWQDSTKKLEKIQYYQINNASKSILPTTWKIQAELLFNKYNIFDRLTPYYLLLGLILLVTIFVNIFKQKVDVSKITKVVLVLLSLGFVVHTFGLGLRWCVAGHAPWSNGYETMIYIAWAIVLSGIFFAKQSNLALATTGILSGITLFVAHLSWMEPQITTLAPVLKSYWLTIHVSVITASYGFLGLSALLGGISLVLFVFINKKKEDDRFFSILLSIKESNRINEMSIMIGLVLLIIGNFLGGIWANESWGRYWGWDPKETWTLVSILVYAIIIHLKYIKGILSDYLFAVLSLVSFASIIMTYFGVNYYLSGKHSYAAGDPIPIPTFIPVTAIVVLVIIILAFRNRKVL